MCTCKLMVTSYRLSSFFCLAKNIGIRISYNESYLSIGLVCQSPSLRANRFANDAYESLKVVRALRNKKVKNLLPAKISNAVDLAILYILNNWGKIHHDSPDCSRSKRKRTHIKSDDG